MRLIITKYVLKIAAFFMLLSSCNSNDNVQIIKAENIFTIDKENYYVLIYLNGCVACRDVKLKISKFDNKIKQDFYYVDLENNKELLYHEFVSNINCSSYKDLKIKKTPTLFKINKGIIVKEYVNSINILSFLNSFVM